MTPDDHEAKAPTPSAVARPILVAILLALALTCVGLVGCAVIRNAVQYAQNPVAATNDEYVPIAEEPTAGLLAQAPRFPWPADAEQLRARWRDREFTHATTNQKVVALTFDDGPGGGTTTKVTDMMEAAGGKATFFCVGGRVLNNPDEVRYAFMHGMEIGNHTWSHRELNRTKHDALTQVRAADAVIGETISVRPLWVRPKSGLMNKDGLAAVAETGHLLAGWDVHAQDTGPLRTDAARITQHVLARVHPGAVIDFHSTNPATLKALPAILRELKSRGYRMVTLSELASLP